MVALWIVLALIAVAAIVLGGVSFAPSRRRTRGGSALEATSRPASRTGAPSVPTRPTVPTGPTGPTGPSGPTGRSADPSAGPTSLAEAADAAPPVGPPSYRARLGRSRGVFAGLRSLRGRSVEPGAWEDLEDTLIGADVGVATTDALLSDLRRRVATKEIADGDALLEALRADLVDLLDVGRRWDAATEEPEGVDPTVAGTTHDSAEPVGRDLRFDDEPGVVNVWLFVGVNGVGKTTTIGKVARQQTARGQSVLLAAGDTFRAAAAEQLSTWAERAGCDVVRGAEGGDPSAVVFDAVQRAGARGQRLVLADTAGRLHTKVNLVEELKKIRRVADRPPGRVTEVLLVLDATTGQNGVAQARQFTDAVGITGVVLTKLDGTAKGGIVIAIQRELGLPVKLVGLGEGPDDLVAFQPGDFVDALLE